MPGAAGSVGSASASLLIEGKRHRGAGNAGNKAARVSWEAREHGDDERSARISASHGPLSLLSSRPLSSPPGDPLLLASSEPGVYASTLTGSVSLCRAALSSPLRWTGKVGRTRDCLQTKEEEKMRRAKRRKERKKTLFNCESTFQRALFIAAFFPVDGT